MAAFDVPASGESICGRRGTQVVPGLDALEEKTSRGDSVSPKRNRAQYLENLRKNERAASRDNLQNGPLLLPFPANKKVKSQIRCLNVYTA